MKDKKIYISRAVFTALTVLLTVLIFGSSSADGETSSGLSLLVTQWLNNALEFLHIPVVLPHLLVRKLAHFAEYSLLGALLTATVQAWSRKPWKFRYVWLPIVIGGCLASLDEWLQTFVPERCGCVSDVLLDMSGVLWAAAAVSLLLCYRSRKTIRTAEPNM